MIDFSKLDDKQIKIANKIAKEAKSQNVNSDYALALAYTENQFGHKTSNKGAIGPMQLMPKTAEGLNVDPNDDDQNIRGGITYLKQGLDKFQGDKDQYTKAAIAYNGGIEHPFFKSKDPADLQQETLDYVDRINQHFPLDSKQSLGGDNTAQAQADTSQHPDETVNTDPNTLPGNEASKLHALEVPAALAGAGASAGLELGHGAYTIKNNLINQALRQPINPNKPITRTGLNAYTQSQLPEDLRSMHLSDLENEVTKARQLKDPKAGKVKLRTMSEVQDALKEVKGSPAERVAKTTSVDPRTGQPKKIYSIKEGSAPVDLAKYKVNPDTPVLNKVVGVAKNAKTFVAPQLMKLGSGALGGLGALSSANDFKNEYEKHGLNNWRTLAKGAGTLGGGLMMVPSPWTEIPGAALSAVGMVPDVVDYFSGEDK